jgi:hypothetical protein
MNHVIETEKRIIVTSEPLRVIWANLAPMLADCMEKAKKRQKRPVK